jgi:hypothetical protein
MRIDVSYTAPMRALVVCLALLALAACGGKAFDYHSDTEIPNTPGVFSKDPEGFTIYNSEKGKPDQTSQKKADESHEGASVAEMEDSQEFEEFEQWKKEKEQFRDYLEWKKSDKGSAAYQEFQEWKEFKAYQEWKQHQEK